MGNEVSRPTGAGDVSPQNSGVVQPSTPSTPTGGFSRRAQSFSAHSPSPSVASPAPQQRRTSSNGNLGGNPKGNPSANPKKERSIQRMDKAIRRRVRGGITYNMKLLLRGAKGTGKTSLFQRLKGEPIPETHQSTPQLQSATINWSFRQNLEENVKCEVWDVVDRGFGPADAEGEGGEAAAGTQIGAVERGGLQKGGSLSVEASAAAVEAAAAMQNGTHSVAVVDASTVDVYREAHGVIFLLDVTKWDTLEYVKQQLDNVPVHIPTLVLGNFRDQGAKRKIFKEDIQELLYGSSDRPQHQQWRRPMELLYFECSLLNCYGLKSLHQYFGIPFLQLKLATIRQQMRIVEGEFAHLKHDVQATISEQRYAEYVNHIRQTGSDIRTGRRGSGNNNTPPPSSRNGSMRLPNREGWNQDDAKSINGEAADDDVSVVSKENGTETPTEKYVPPATATVATEAEQPEQEAKQTVDTEDLPARSSSAVIMAASPLLFEHKESVTSILDDVVEDGTDKPVVPVKRSSSALGATNATSGRPRKTSVEEVIHLEDFKVPKTRISDLDHFYSEESDDDVGEYDEDVVVAPVDGAMKTALSGVYHKQRFIDSDSSDSDESEIVGTQNRRKEKGSRKSPPRRAATKQAICAGQQVPRPPMSSPYPPASPSRPSQRGRPGSPARQQPTGPAEDASPQQTQSSASSGDTGGVSPTSPAAPPASPLASSTRHLSPRNESDISTALPEPEASTALSQEEIEVQHLSSSSGEIELTDTEDAIESMGRDKEERADGSIKQESPKNSNCTYSPGKDSGHHHCPYRENTCRIAPQGSNSEEIDGGTSSPIVTVDMPIQPDSDHEIDSDANLDDGLEVVSVPTYYQANEPAEDEGDVSPATGDENGDLLANTDDLKTFPTEEGTGNGSDGEDQDAQVQNEMAVAPISPPPSSVYHRLEVLMSDEESGEGTKGGTAELSVTSLQASMPIPDTSSSYVDVLPASMGMQSSATESQDGMGHFHKRNLEESDDLLSLSALQASLPIPGHDVSSLSAMHQSMDARRGYENEGSDIKMESTALLLSDLEEPPVKTSSAALAPDFTTVVPRNDLEAFLNESDSDSEDASPSYTEPAGRAKQSMKQSLNDKRAMVESSDDDDDEEEDQERFANYNLNKKNRSERKRQQKEGLRQLNAALNTVATENERSVTPSGGVAVAESSFGTSDVMEAIRKAQEEAMRMIPSAPVAVDDDDADSSSSKRRHKHKHKKEHKHKKREGEEGKEKSSKKSSRKSSSGTHSKKHRPRVEGDFA